VTDARRHSPAAERNRVPIGAELQRLLPAAGVALEIASGTGQHAAFFAAALPGWSWWPSDGDARNAASIAAWSEGLAHVQRPITLDVMSPSWPGVPDRVDAVFCANLLHISPWPATEALMQGTARHLAPTGRLLIYGPFIEDGVPTAPGNQAFDAGLRSRDPAWGLRRLADVQAQAVAAGLRLHERIVMPANNRLLVFVKGAAG
jgi:SAM-dependent methyltransferase